MKTAPIGPTRRNRIQGVAALPIVLALLFSSPVLSSAQPTPTPQTLLTQGQTLLTQGQYQAAIDQFRASLALLQSWGNRDEIQDDRARNQGYLGLAYGYLGQYQAAVEANTLAARWVLAQRDRFTANPAQLRRYQTWLGQITLNLGNSFEAVGDYDRALAAYQQSLTISQTIGDRSGEAIALGNQGLVYGKQANYAQALDRHRRSLALHQTLGQVTGQVDTLINLGSLYHSQKDLNLAEKQYRQAQQIIPKIGDQQQRRRQASAVGINLGLLYDDRQQYPQAIAEYQKSLAIAASLSDPKLIATIHNNLGHSYYKSGQFTAAEPEVKQAIDQLDRLLTGLTDSYKVSLFDTQTHSYSLLQKIRIANRQPDRALEAAEQGRARPFAQLLAQRRATPTPTIPPITLAQIQSIARRQNVTLVAYSIVPEDGFKFQGKQQAKEASLAIWVVQPSGKISFRQIDFKPYLDKNLRLTDLISTARCLSIACPTLDELIDERRALSPPLKLAQFPFAQSPSPAELGIPPGLSELHQLLIEPIADLLPRNPTDRVVFIPQGPLFLVPFAALADRQGHYLIEKHTIATAPSIQILDFTQTRQSSHTSATDWGHLVVGNPSPMPLNLSPLPASEREAIAVAKLLQTEPLIGTKATKKTVIDRLNRASIIHLATHGLLDYASGPRTSLDTPGAIALATTPTDNGLLTAVDILTQLNLQAELVVLSACDTGRGQITGDGVVGLGRSLIAAGTPSAIVSLWAVNDESTAALMVEFYRSLQRGDNHGVALRKAMLATIVQFPEPKDWAAFVLVGQ
jgi:CHAT domain-containing protein